MPSVEEIKRALLEVLPNKRVRKAYLFGSFARGDQSSQSDVDLRFLCDEGVTFAELDDIQKELEGRLGRATDIVTASPSQMRPRFYDRIRRDEVLLYEAV